MGSPRTFIPAMFPVFAANESSFDTESLQQPDHSLSTFACRIFKAIFLQKNSSANLRFLLYSLTNTYLPSCHTISECKIRVGRYSQSVRWNLVCCRKQSHCSQSVRWNLVCCRKQSHCRLIADSQSHCRQTLQKTNAGFVCCRKQSQPSISHVGTASPCGGQHGG